ncbi:MAG: ABC transporter substrate-binding protein [Flavobacteriales bacterium]|jgi:iron complex transport system substrate-binding protein|nr:ABC transporter substrate-binding protein [Flavobacteriales bacterium]
MIKKILAFLIGFVLISCNGEQQKKVSPNTPPQKNTVSTKIKYSKGFKILEKDGIKKLLILDPFSNYKVQQTIVLLKQQQAYTPAENEVLVYTPIQSIIPFSTSYISMIDTLDKLNSIVAIENKNYIYNQRLLNNVSEDKVRTTGPINQLDLEVILTIQPDVLVTIGSSGEQPQQLQKLIRAGIPSINNYDWKENHPLGKAEWIKFFGALYEKEAEAEAIFNGIETNYNRYKNLVKPNHPNVLFSSLYNGTWYIPGGNSYPSQFVKDAGGTYPWINDTTTGSLPLSFETIANKQAQPDIWLNPNYNYIKDMTNADSRYFSFLKNVKENIYNSNKRTTPHGGNDYWEKGTLRPDLVLKDYIELFKLDLCNEDSLVFFKKVHP